MNLELLAAVAAKIKTGYELMGSKWSNAEAELIAVQTISACQMNQKDHGDAFSWLAGSATTGRRQCGTNNARGLAMLIEDGSLVQEDYAGTLTSPPGTAIHNGKPQVLRVTNRLLHYAASMVL